MTIQLIPEKPILLQGYNTECVVSAMVGEVSNITEDTGCFEVEYLDK